MARRSLLYPVPQRRLNKSETINFTGTIKRWGSADVSQPEQVQKMIAQAWHPTVRQDFDYAVNNAGLTGEHGKKHNRANG